MNNAPISDEVSYLYHATFQCCEERQGYDGAWQLAPFQCSIPYQDNAISRLLNLREFLREEFPELIDFGERRAKKAFEERRSTTTKPSYISRIENFLQDGFDQKQNLLEIAKREPASGGLVFSVFTPHDILDRKRPGYVPCLVSGSFLLHENELHLNAFFRSQSVVEFGLFDMLFLRQFQQEFFELYSARATPRLGEIKMGPLNLQLARVLVHRRFLKRNKSFVPRAEIVHKWLHKVEEFMLLNREASAYN
ncbi:hypothetical protein [Pelagibius marinus]|uniref:hypothetical protein n=1 Tax=Pelagibius marinus TaxID=2762760 RepID=UPI001872A10F|nr:hypothetical protein [Pelagibius marinus]